LKFTDNIFVKHLSAKNFLFFQFGKTPQYYVEHKNELTQESLLKDLSAPSQVAKEMLSDKGMCMILQDKTKQPFTFQFVSAIVIHSIFLYLTVTR